MKHRNTHRQLHTGIIAKRLTALLLALVLCLTGIQFPETAEKVYAAKRSGLTYKEYVDRGNVIPSSTLFIGTYLMDASAFNLTEQEKADAAVAAARATVSGGDAATAQAAKTGISALIYQKAKKSQTDYDQKTAYYRSELAGGQWRDIVGSSGINNIMTSARTVEKTELDPLLITCVIGADGIPRDPESGQPINIFDFPSPYEMEEIPELKPIQDFYNSGTVTKDSKASENYLYWRLYYFFEHDNIESYDRDSVNLTRVYQSYDALVNDKSKGRNLEDIWDLAEVKGDIKADDTGMGANGNADFKNVVRNWPNVHDSKTDEDDEGLTTVYQLYLDLTAQNLGEEAEEALSISSKLDADRRAEVFYNMLRNKNIMTGSQTNSVDEDIENVDTDIAALQAKIAQIQTVEIPDLEKRLSDFNDDTELKELSDFLTEYQDKLKTAQDELAAMNAPTKPEENEILAMTESQVNDVKTALEKDREYLTKLNEKLAPTDQTIAELTTLLNAAEQFEKYNRVTTIREQLTNVQDLKKDYEDAIKELQDEITKYENIVNTWTKEAAEAYAKSLEDYQTAISGTTEKQREIYEIENTVQQIEDAISARETYIAERKTVYQTEIEQKNSAIESYQRQIGYLEEKKQCLTEMRAAIANGNQKEAVALHFERELRDFLYQKEELEITRHDYETELAHLMADLAELNADLVKLEAEYAAEQETSAAEIAEQQEKVDRLTAQKEELENLPDTHEEIVTYREKKAEFEDKLAKMELSYVRKSGYETKRNEILRNIEGAWGYAIRKWMECQALYEYYTATGNVLARSVKSDITGWKYRVDVEKESFQKQVNSTFTPEIANALTDYYEKLDTYIAYEATKEFWEGRKIDLAQQKIVELTGEVEKANRAQAVAKIVLNNAESKVGDESAFLEPPAIETTCLDTAKSLMEDLADVKETLEYWENAVNTRVETELPAIEESLKEEEEKLAELKSASPAALAKKQSEINIKKQEIEAKQKQINAKRAEEGYSDLIFDENEELLTLRVEMERLPIQIEKLQSELEKLEKEAEELTSREGALNTEEKVLDTEIKELETKQETLNAELAALRTEVKSDNDEIKELNAKIDNLKAERDKAANPDEDEELTKLKRELEQKQTELQNAVSDLRKEEYTAAKNDVVNSTGSKWKTAIQNRMSWGEAKANEVANERWFGPDFDTMVERYRKAEEQRRKAFSDALYQNIQSNYADAILNYYEKYYEYDAANYLYNSYWKNLEGSSADAEALENATAKREQLRQEMNAARSALSDLENAIGEDPVILNSDYTTPEQLQNYTGEFQAAVNEANQKIETRRAEIAALQADLDDQIAEAEEELAKAQDEAAAAAGEEQAEFAAKQAEVRANQTELTAKRREISETRREISATQREEIAKKNEIEAKQKELESKQKELTEKTDELNQKQAEIDEKNQKAEWANLEEGTTSYKLAELDVKIQTTRDVITQARAEASGYEDAEEFAIGPTLLFLQELASEGHSPAGRDFTNMDAYRDRALIAFNTNRELNSAITSGIANSEAAFVKYREEGLTRGETVGDDVRYRYSRQVIQAGKSQETALPLLQTLVDLTHIEASESVHAERELKLLDDTLLPQSLNRVENAKLDQNAMSETDYKRDVEEYQNYIYARTNLINVNDAITYVEQRITYAKSLQKEASDWAQAQITTHLEWLNNLLKQLKGDGYGKNDLLDKLKAEKLELEEKYENDKYDDPNNALKEQTLLDSKNKAIADIINDTLNDPDANTNDKIKALGELGGKPFVEDFLQDDAIEKIKNDDYDIDDDLDKLKGIGGDVGPIIDALNDHGAPPDIIDNAKDADEISKKNPLADFGNGPSGPDDGGGGGSGSNTSGSGDGTGNTGGNGGDGGFGDGDGDDSSGDLGVGKDRDSLNGNDIDDVIKNLFGDDFSNLSDAQRAAILAALAKYGALYGDDPVLAYARYLLDQLLGDSNGFIYQQYLGDRSEEYVSFGSLDMTRRYSKFRYVSQGQDKTLSQIAGGSASYVFAVGTEDVTKNDGRTDTMTKPMVQQTDKYLHQNDATLYPYITEEYAIKYTGCSAQYMPDTDWAILVTPQFEQQIQNIMDELSSVATALYAGG